MGKNKRKSQSADIQTPKKVKLNQENQQIPDSNKKSPNNAPKNVGAKSENEGKKNKKANKLKKFSGTTNLEENEKKSTSDDEVEQEIKPEKITKTINEDEPDKDNEMSDCDDSNDEEAKQEEVDNAVNENSENDKKKQKGIKKDQKIKTSKEGKESKVKHTEKLKTLVENNSTKRKMRYVLFIGNIPYTSTVEDIKSHFEKECKIISVRIPKTKETNKPRGFCYLEVADNASYLKAMSRHHSTMDGRLINVLYTTGNKKDNAQDVKKKIKSKNFKLNALRKGGKLDGNMKHDNKRSVRRAKKRAFEKNNE